VSDVIESLLIRGGENQFAFAGLADDVLTVHAEGEIGQAFRCNGRMLQRRLTPGVIDLIPAGAEVELEDQGAHAVLVMQAPAALSELAADSVGLRPGDLTPLIDMRDLSITAFAWALHRVPAEDRLHRECASLELVRRLVWRRLPSAKLAPDRGRALSGRAAQRLLDFIEGNIDRQLSLRELSAETGLAATSFKAAFRATFGVPVHRFVVWRRAERARLLLLEGRLPPAQVALEVGFAHQSHMARWLSRLFGVLPSELTARAA
jgi:AraC family transcriptional regulator